MTRSISALTSAGSGPFASSAANSNNSGDLAQQYGIPLQKGVPALAVLDAHGRAIYSQRQGEFEAMRKMDPNSVTEFLEHWKPRRD